MKEISAKCLDDTQFEFTHIRSNFKLQINRLQIQSQSHTYTWDRFGGHVLE